MRNKYLALSGIVFLIFVILMLNLDIFEGLNEAVNSHLIFSEENVSFELIHYLTFLGSTYFLAIFSAVVFIFLIYSKREREGIHFIVTVLIGAFVHSALKEILQVVRPVNSLEFGFSFPSGHTFGAALVYWSLALIIDKKYPKTRISLFILPFLIGLTRLLLGVHWLSDVLGGLLLALGVVLFSRSINLS